MSSEYFAYGDSKLYNIQNGLFPQNKKFVHRRGHPPGERIFLPEKQNGFIVRCARNPFCG